MKIKTKKQLNLPQLIEWGFENDVTNKEYVCNEHKAKSVIFNLSGWAEFSDEFSYNPHDTFTVEVEEEITEDTKFDLLLDHFTTTYGHDSVGDLHRHKSINDILEENDDLGIATNSIHTFDRETNTFNLIWRNGKLVE